MRAQSAHRRAGKKPRPEPSIEDMGGKPARTDTELKQRAYHFAEIGVGAGSDLALSIGLHLFGEMNVWHPGPSGCSDKIG